MGVILECNTILLNFLVSITMLKLSYQFWKWEAVEALFLKDNSIYYEAMIILLISFLTGIAIVRQINRTDW